MLQNQVMKILKRRLRLAVIGGGPDSFIGGTHRQAARIDDAYKLVAGVLSSDAEKSKAYGLGIGLAKNRAYPCVNEMLQAEKERADGAEVVAVMTPNDTHYEYSAAALEKGFHVICDKPMTNTLDDAENLYQKVEDTGLVFCLTHNYTGYPMVRQAKAMVMDGQLGEIMLCQVEYVQGWNADKNKPVHSNGHIPWRFDPLKGGPSLVMGDIGSHAHNLIRFITGLEVEEVAAEVGSIVPGRNTHDFAGAMLRFENGARGNFWITQAAAGVENCIRIRVSGSKGTLEWEHEHNQKLIFKPVNNPVQIRTYNGPGTSSFAGRGCRIVAGHSEGYHEAFANIYLDAAEVIASKLAGVKPDPLSLYFPNAGDGLKGMQFIKAVLASSKVNGLWMEC
jgi:predicted dehydrogenase